MRTVTFEWNGGVFEAVEETVSAGVDVMYVANLLPRTTSDRVWRHYADYGSFLATVRLKSGDPGFTIPSLDDPEAIVAFYQTFQELPYRFRTTYAAAQESVARPINEPELTPGVEKKENETPNIEENVSTNSAA